MNSLENLQPVRSRVNEWIELSVAEHRRMQAELPYLQELAGESAEANPQEPICCAVGEKATALVTSMQQLFEREEQTLFPMLRRLSAATMISPCRAGSVGAWIRQVKRLQDELIYELGQLRQLATLRLAPVGPCESCRTLIQWIDTFRPALLEHAGREQQGLRS